MCVHIPSELCLQPIDIHSLFPSLYFSHKYSYPLEWHCFTCQAIANNEANSPCMSQPSHIISHSSFYPSYHTHPSLKTTPNVFPEPPHAHPRGFLRYLMEIGRFHGSDPIITTLESSSWIWRSVRGGFYGDAGGGCTGGGGDWFRSTGPSSPPFPMCHKDRNTCRRRNLQLASYVAPTSNFPRAPPGSRPRPPRRPLHSRPIPNNLRATRPTNFPLQISLRQRTTTHQHQRSQTIHEIQYDSKYIRHLCI